MRLFYYVSLILIEWAIIAMTADQLDHIHIILNNPKSVQSYSNCLLNTGTCNSDGNALKSFLPTIINTKCSACTDRQKVAACTVILTMQTRYPGIWTNLLKKYDPNGQHSDELQAFKANCQKQYNIRAK